MDLINQTALQKTKDTEKKENDVLKTIKIQNVSILIVLISSVKNIVSLLFSIYINSVVTILWRMSVFNLRGYNHYIDKQISLNRKFFLLKPRQCQSFCSLYILVPVSYSHFCHTCSICNVHLSYGFTSI
jgi:hypothetical protein